MVGDVFVVKHTKPKISGDEGGSGGGAKRALLMVEDGRGCDCCGDNGGGDNGSGKRLMVAEHTSNQT